MWGSDWLGTVELGHSVYLGRGRVVCINIFRDVGVC